MQHKLDQRGNLFMQSITGKIVLGFKLFYRYYAMLPITRRFVDSPSTIC